MSEADVVSDWAYAAGIIDGEGCIYSSYPKSKSAVVQVQLQMKHEAVPRWMHERFGGNLHVYEDQFPMWRIHGKSAAWMLDMILPFLVEKRRQAELALSMAETLGILHRGSPEVVREDIHGQRRVIGRKMRTLRHDGPNAILD